MATKTGSVFVTSSASLGISSASYPIKLVGAGSEVLASWSGYTGSTGSSSVTLFPDVVGIATLSSNDGYGLCSPGRRADNEFFRRLLISEVLVDPGTNDLNLDNASNLLADRPNGGYQDAFIEIVNQECYSVDISGWTLCVTCPQVCLPTSEGCFAPPPPQDCTP